MGRRVRNSSETISRVSVLFDDAPSGHGIAGPGSSSQPVASSSRSHSGGPSVGGPVATQTRTTTRLKRKANPPRPDQEVIVLSSSSSDAHISSSDAPTYITVSSGSDAPSHFTVSSSSSSVVDITDLVAARKTQLRQVKANATRVASDKGKSSMSPLPSTSGSVKRTLSSSQRASAGTSKSKLVQTTLSFTRKRKHDDTEPGSSQPGTPSLKVPTPSLPKTRSPSTSQKSPQTRPLAPKDNVPTERPRSNSVKKPSPPKKLRLSSPEPGLLAPASGHSADRSGLVPSSQSDEQELCAPKLVVKDPVAVKESVDKWRKETSIAPRSEGASSQAGQSPSEDMHFNIDTGADFNIDVGMQDDIPEDAPEELLPSGPSDVPGPRSETEVSMQLRVRSSASTLGSARKSAVPISPVITVPTLAVTCASSSEPSASRPVTPPLPEATLLPRPSTPLALTTESKTAKIIADIKANAAAALPSSSEDEGPRQLRDLSDSSDDDSFNGGFFASKKNDKGKGKAVASPRKLSSTGFSSPLSKLGSSPPTRTGAKRYSLRNRFVAAQSSSDESDHAPAPAPVRKPRKSNALDALLKEKKQAEKQGKGSSAVQVAEEALASYHRSKQGMKDEMDDEEASASEPRAARRGTPSASATPSATSDRETEGEDEDVDDMDIEGILGEEGGKAVGRILEDDKTSKEAQSRARRKDRVLGVPLWEPALRDEDADMESFELPAFPLSETDLAKDALLRLLADAVTRQDVAQVTVIFNVGVLSQLSHEYQITLIPWLYDIATSPADRYIVDAAYNVLHHIATSSTSPQPFNLPFTSILQMLKRLGAKPAVLEIFEKAGGAPPVRKRIDESERGDILFYAVSLINVFASNGGVHVDALPNFMMAMLLIALDPSSTLDLKRDSAAAFENLGRAIPDSADGPFGIGSAACAKIIKFAKELEPFNQAYMLSFIMASSPPTTRMARWIARRLLLDSSSPIFEKYCALPPLAPIVELLTAPANSEGPFDIVGNGRKPEYYENLSYYIELLSRTLTDIDEYVAEEAKEEAEADVTEASSPSKMGLGKEKPPTELEQIKNLLERLHGKIVDTRAADLDRSRAKAALQQLSFRIHYQRIAVVRSRKPRRQPTNLHNYFASPSK